MEFVVITNCPVPAKVAPAIQAIRVRVHRNHGYWPTINSAYRGDAAARLLKRLHKHTQRFLYAMFLRHVPGYYPANKPDTSTHELCSDSVAYRGPVGRPLPQWCQGFDWDDAAVPHVLEAARQLGMPMFQPYPGGKEYHHTNFRRRPPRKFYR